MDGQRFDAIARAMATGRSRRGFLGTLAAGVAVLAGAGRSPALAQTCNLGACQTNADCTCDLVEQCGNDGECCRPHIGVYCNPDETGSHCCGPNYICTTPGVFPAPPGGGCQCNTAEGFTQDPTTGTCCIANGTAGNANHPDLCCSGCVCEDGNCCDASHCQEPVCAEPGQACNACHACCEGSRCTKPDAPCTGPADAGVCCLKNGSKGNANHPDLCCSGCVCSDGNCCDASHCQQCSGGTVPCGSQCIDPTTQCCADEEIGILCQAPGFKTKCCPQGHQCNKHEKSKTFDCGIKPKSAKGKGVGKESKKRR